MWDLATVGSVASVNCSELNEFADPMTLFAFIFRRALVKWKVFLDQLSMINWQFKVIAGIILTTNSTKWIFRFAHLKLLGEGEKFDSFIVPINAWKLATFRLEQKSARRDWHINCRLSHTKEGAFDVSRYQETCLWLFQGGLCDDDVRNIQQWKL